MEGKLSPFKLVGFLVEESHIVRVPNKKAAKIKIEILPSGLINETSKAFQLNLIVNVTDENESFTSSITAVGIFNFKNVTKKDDLPNYFFVNAPAIIYPYIRSYIAGLTALSGMDAINLPLMAMGNLGAKLKENTQSVNAEK